MKIPVAAFLFLFCLVYLVFMSQIKGYWTTTSKGQRKMEIYCRKYYIISETNKNGRPTFWSMKPRFNDLAHSNLTAFQLFGHMF